MTFEEFKAEVNRVFPKYTWSFCNSSFSMNAGVSKKNLSGGRNPVININYTAQLGWKFFLPGGKTTKTHALLENAKKEAGF